MKKLKYKYEFSVVYVFENHRKTYKGYDKRGIQYLTLDELKKYITDIFITSKLFGRNIFPISAKIIDRETNKVVFEKSIASIFNYVNVNPNSKDTSKGLMCAFSNALGKSWLEIYDLLCKVGRELNAMPSDEITYLELLKRLNAKEIELNNKPEISQFALSHNGRYIIKLKHRLTACINNRLYDEKDYTGYQVFKAWKIG